MRREQTPLRRNPESHPGRPAVFLDRDGTLIEDRGTLRSPSQIHVFPDTVPALRRLQGDHALFIVTHQPGIAAGLVSPDEVAAVNQALVDRLAAEGVRIEAVYCCPHGREDGCVCIKPNPFSLLEAERDYGVDLRRSFTVGDHAHDVELASAVGAVGLYVRTGHGERHLSRLSEDTTVLPGIREVADWICAWRAFEAAAGPEGAEARLSEAARRLRDGGVVVFPTETVYGLGAPAFDTDAVARVFEIKRRPRFDPLIVHIGARRELAGLAAAVSSSAEALMARFWPGPLTLVLPKTPAVPDLVTAGLPTVAVRMPRHPVALACLRRAGVPVAAPSANPFGRTSPTCAAHVRERLGAQVDALLDGGPCTVGVESTIIQADGDRWILLRPGGVPVEEIEEVTGPLVQVAAVDDRPRAPGRLARHYATRTPLRLRPAGAEPASRGRMGLIAFSPPGSDTGYAAVEVLSTTGDLREAAARLFSVMRRLDALGLDGIDADMAPDHGLGRAINDRLRRASFA